MPELLCRESWYLLRNERETEMWKGKNGPCTCFYCTESKPHPTRETHALTDKRGHLQVAESLNPKDILWTKMCPLCTHEEI